MKLSKKLEKLRKKKMKDENPAQQIGYSTDFAKRMAGNTAVLYARALLAGSKEEFQEGMELLVKMACVVIYTNFGWDAVTEALNRIDKKDMDALIKELEENARS